MRSRRLFQGGVLPKYLAALAALGLLWAEGETMWLTVPLTALLTGPPLWGLLSWARLRRQRVTYAPGGVRVRSQWGRERAVSAREVGGLMLTADRLLLFDREGRRLCAVARSNAVQRTAGADALAALLAPAGGLMWDKEPFTLRRSRGRRVWTAASAALLAALWLAAGVFLQATGQLDRESLENWLFLAALLAGWSAWRCRAVFRRRLLVDETGITAFSPLGRSRHFPWAALRPEHERDGLPKLPDGISLAGWGRETLALCCALRDHGLLAVGAAELEF